MNNEKWQVVQDIADNLKAIKGTEFARTCVVHAQAEEFRTVIESLSSVGVVSPYVAAASNEVVTRLLSELIEARALDAQEVAHWSNIMRHKAQ